MQSTQSDSPAVRGCLDACRRCEQIIDAISPECYATSAPGRAPIGAHLRHVVDHFSSLSRGLDAGLIDYDARERDESMERDPELLRQALWRISAQLRTIPAAALTRRIAVRQRAAIDAPPNRLESTLERELVFLSGHTIHHLAVVIGLCREIGIDISDDLALAFSTAAHRQTAE
jgi:hypothetical protein